MARNLVVFLLIVGLAIVFLAFDTTAQNSSRNYNTEALFSPATLPDPQRWNNGAGILDNDALLKGLLQEHNLKDPFASYLGTRYLRESRFGVTDYVVGELRRARQEVRIAMYTLTSQELSDTLIALHRSGRVRVRIVLDKVQSNSKYNRGDKTEELQQAGLEVRLAGDPDEGSNSPKMHHKFAVVDDNTVITGSFNWTVAANEQNYENLLVLRNEHLTTAKFLAEFDWLWWYAGNQGRNNDSGNR